MTKELSKKIRDTILEELAEKIRNNLLEIVSWSNDQNQKTALYAIEELANETLDNVNTYIETLKVKSEDTLYNEIVKDVERRRLDGDLHFDVESVYAVAKAVEDQLKGK